MRVTDLKSGSPELAWARSSWPKAKHSAAAAAESAYHLQRYLELLFIQ